MTNIAVLGAAWGDEGKGHITHHLSRDYDWVVRFNGGANAGHTIWRDGVKFVHNLLPSVDFRNPNVKAYLGAGMVIDLQKLRDEVYDLEDHYPGASQRIYVDREAFMVLDTHKEEDKKTNGHIGSTNRGIGPAYVDKVGRKGMRLDDLWHGCNPYYDDFMYQLCNSGKGVNFVHASEMRSKMEGTNLLFEGAQGVMLDINHGIYPYVSCSDCTIAGIISSGFAWAKLEKVYGVVKCYTTKVGEGPFPSEIKGDEAERLRNRGQEFGATTGRARRVGWLDLPALRYAIAKSGIDALVMTKFDILNGMEQIKVCAAYERKDDFGKTVIGNEPVCPRDFFKAQPRYIDVPGWEDASHPDQLFPFLSVVKNATNCPIEMVSCGTEDKDIKDIVW